MPVTQEVVSTTTRRCSTLRCSPADADNASYQQDETESTARLALRLWYDNFAEIHSSSRIAPAMVRNKRLQTLLRGTLLRNSLRVALVSCGGFRRL
jgi:hypothetical protein